MLDDGNVRLQTMGRVRQMFGRLSLLLMLLLWPAVAFGAADVMPGEILVKYRSDAGEWRGHALRQAVDVVAGERLKTLGITRLQLAPGVDLGGALAALRADPDVVYAEPNYVRRPTFVPNDPDYAPDQYAPRLIDAENAWNVTLGQPGVIIAVIDSGVAGGHPDLTGHVLPGIDDAVYPVGHGPTGPWHDALGHGTHVAGIAAASINNAIGIAGIAGRATILPIKVFPDTDEAGDSEVAQAIHDAVDHGARVINLSLGGAESSQTLQDAVNYAWGKGAVIVAAAGNDASSETFYPADAVHTLAIASSNGRDQPSGFTNYGPAISLDAPGDTIYSTLPGGRYGFLSGTSMATPFVAGVAALAFSAYPNSTNGWVVAALERGADKVGPYPYDSDGRNDHYGYGRVNAYQTLAALASLQRTAVYRLYWAARDDHLYTASAAEKSALVAAGYYALEGVCGYAPTQAGANTKPVFRLYNPVTGEHFYTANTAERDFAVATLGYHDEGPAFRVFTSAAAGTVPFYRLYSPFVHRHFYTTSQAERDYAVSRLGYRYEGTMGYLYAQSR